MANGGHDGSISFSTALDNKRLEKQLAELSKKIVKKTQDIAKLTQKRDTVKRNDLFDGRELDAEKAKLQEITDRLADIRAMAKDKSLGTAQREQAKELIPSLREELADQRVRVRGLQTEWNKLHNAAERYDVQIAEATAELERQKKAAGQIQEKLDESAGVGAQERMAAYLEKNSTLYRQATSLLGKTADASTVLEGLAGATDGKLSGAFQTASTAVSGFGTALSCVATKAAPFLAVATAVLGLLKKLWNAAKEFSVGFTNALKRGAAAVYGFSNSVARNFVAALKTIGRLSGSFVKTVAGITKNIVHLTKRLNVFSRMAETLGGVVKRLGSTIKSALVFSVLYKGLSLLRDQVGAYLMVNEQFSTALRRLQGVLLTAFQPIYDVVVPALTALVNALTHAITVLAQFFAGLFGTTAKTVQANARALYGEAKALRAAGKAAEEAAGSLAGFDEINQIQTEDKIGSGSGSPDTGAIFDYSYEEIPFASWGEIFNAFLDDLLEGIPKLEAAFQSFADSLNSWTQKAYDMLTFPGMPDKVKQLGQDLAEALNGLVDAIEWELLGLALGAGLNLALNVLTSFLYAFDWTELGHSLAALVNGLAAEIDWYEFGRLLWAGFKIGLEILAGFLSGLDMPLIAQAASDTVLGFFIEMESTIHRVSWYKLGEQIAELLNNIKWYDCLLTAIHAIQAAFRAMEQTLAGFVNHLYWGEIAEAIYTAINDSLSNMSWRNFADTLGNLFIQVFDFLRDVTTGINWHQIGRDIADSILSFDFAGALGSLADLVAEGINAAARLAQGSLDRSGPEVQNIAKGLAERLKTAVRTAHWDELGQVIGGGIKTALSFVAGLLDPELFYETGKTIGDFLVSLDWTGIVGGLTEALSNGVRSAVAAVLGFLDAVQPDLREIAEGIAEKINQFVRDVDWAELGKTIHDGISAALDFLIGILDSLDWDGIGQAVVDFLMNLQWGDLLKRWGDVVGKAIGGALKGISLGDILSFGGDIVAGMLQGMLNKWGESGGIFGWIKRMLFSPFLDSFKSLFGINSPSTVMAEQGGYLVSGIFQGISEAWHTIIDLLAEKLSALEKSLSDNWKNIQSAASEKWREIKDSTLGKAWDAICENAKTKFGETAQKISDAWDSVKKETPVKWNEIRTSLGVSWEQVKVSAGEKFQSIKDTIIQKMGELKNHSWQSIGETIVSGIVNGLQTIWNTLTGWVRDVKNTISGALSGTNSSRGGGFGSSSSGSFGSQARVAVQAVPDIAGYTVPALAQGAVIPPNREFLAVLGDQRSGNNLEFPENLLRQIVREEAGGSGDVAALLRQILAAVKSGHIILVDGTVFGRTAIRTINGVNAAAGKQMLIL